MMAPSKILIPKIKQNPKWRMIAIALAILALSGWMISEARIRFPNRSHFMNDYTQNLKTVCVGRYLWDVPQQAEIGSFNQSVNDIQIERLPEETKSEGMYQLRLDQYEKELRKELAQLKYSGIKEVRPFGTNGKLFIYRRDDINNDLLNAAAYILVGTSIYKMEKTDFAIENLNERLQMLTRVAASIRPRSVDEIPRDPGLCIDGAFVAGKNFEDTISIPFKLPNYAGFTMSFSTELGGEPEDNEKLNARTIRGWSMAGYSDEFHIHRKTSTHVLGQPGNELVVSTNQKDRPSLMGEAEFWGDRSKHTQSFSFSMENATYDETEHTSYPKALPDETAMAIWDAMLKTLRVRPGAI
jgi:hypothetical protein